MPEVNSHLEALKKEMTENPDIIDDKVLLLLKNKEEFKKLIENNEDLQEFLTIFPEDRHVFFFNNIIQQPEVLEKLTPYIGEIIKFSKAFNNREEVINFILNNDNIFKKIIILPNFLKLFLNECGGDQNVFLNKVLNNREYLKIFIRDLYCFEQAKDKFSDQFSLIEERILSPHFFIDFIANQDFLYTNEGRSFEKLKEVLKISDDQILKILLQALENSHKKFISIPEWEVGIKEFLRLPADKMYYKNIDKNFIIYELILLYLYPEKVKQGPRNLCGPASLTMLLLEHVPQKVFIAFFELLRKGVSSSLLPLQASRESTKNDKAFSQIFLNAIKHASNVFGYSPVLFETYRGITDPKSLCQLLERCGFQDINEATLVVSNDGKKLPETLCKVFGIYSSQHQVHKDILNNLNEADSHLKAGKDVILFVIGDYFTRVSLESQRVTIVGNAPSTTTLFGMMPMQHYIVAKEMHIEEDKIKLKCWSYGTIYQMELPLQSFLKNYCGFISAKAPDVQPELINNPRV